MSRRITAPRDASDTFNTAGDTILAHEPGVAQAYRSAAAEVRQRQESGLPPAGSVQVTTQVPASVPLPDLGSSRQIIGAEIARLASQAEALRRQAEAPPLGLGNPNAAGNPYLAQVHQIQATQREQASTQLAAVQAEMDGLQAVMADPARVQNWAASYMATRPGVIRA
jgi:hypothetical protein